MAVAALEVGTRPGQGIERVKGENERRVEAGLAAASPLRLSLIHISKENFALDKDAKIVICLYPRITVRFLIAKKSLRLSRRLFFAIRRENRLSSFQPSRLLMQIVSDFKVGDGHRPGKIIPLSNVAVDLGEEIHLFLGLHPLAHHLRVKRLRHFNNALDDAIGAVSLGCLLYTSRCV